MHATSTTTTSGGGAAMVSEPVTVEESRQLALLGDERPAQKGA